MPNQSGFWIDWNAICHLIFSEPCTMHFVLPHFQFSILNCGFKANRITRLQKRAIRVITNSKYNAHVEPLLKQLNLSEVSDIFNNSPLKLFHKYKSWNLPHYIMHIFSDPTSTYDYNTRSHTILDHPTTHLLGSENCVRYQLPRVIEKAHPNILEKVNTHCYTVFFIPTENQCTKLQIRMQPAELLYVPKWRLMIHFHASFMSYYILLWQLFYVPFLSCMYIPCPFSLSSFSLCFLNIVYLTVLNDNAVSY